jgi:carboxyl-terminal processing protease
MQYKNRNTSIYLPILLSVFFVGGIFIGLFLQGNNYQKKRILGSQQTDKLNGVISYIESEYVDPVSRHNLVEVAIPSMLRSLDPHSIYIPAKDLQKMNEPLEGNFEGIGIQFNMPNDTVVVVSTISGGPSDLIGILPGDRIIKINDTIIAGVKIKDEEIVKRLKGPRGTKVNVSILRKRTPELLEFEITRGKIPLYSVDVAYMVTDEIGYIKISKFSKTTFQEFLKGIDKLKNLNCKKLILDLRNNGGGYMDAATNIADQFLEKGKLIVYTEGKSRPRDEIFAREEGVFLKGDMIILIDEWSASASEILAGAIQDNDRGTIMGRRSFGKGLVQEPLMLSDGSAIRLTIARYYTPTGRCIQKPYDNGTENYYSDLHERYINGEFQEADSIKFADSLKHITPGGKIVYGGGGIMPDIFIPIDTAGLTPYYMQVRNRGLIYRFAFEYSDQNREKLNKYKNYTEISKYLDSQNLLKEFIAYASKAGIKKNQKEIDISAHILLTQTKAYIARNIMDNDGFYPILKDIDNTLLTAIEYLTEK